MCRLVVLLRVWVLWDWRLWIGRCLPLYYLVYWGDVFGWWLVLVVVIN